MSTANFIGNDYFDDYAFIYERLSDEDIKTYEEIHECTYNYEAEAEFNYDAEYENTKWIINKALEKFNITLFNIEIESGYYDGMELIVTSGISDLSVDDIVDTEYLKENYDNEDMRYYFGHLAEYKSQIIPKIKAEIKRMNKKVLPYISKNSGFRRINKIAQFSNGEAIYTWAS